MSNDNLIETQDLSVGFPVGGKIFNKRTLMAVNRWLSAVNTSYSPEFVLSNLARDLQTAGYNLTNTELKDMELKVLGDVPKAKTLTS